MRIFKLIENYKIQETFKCRHCGEITSHQMMKVREIRVEPERQDENKVLLVWF